MPFTIDGKHYVVRARQWCKSCLDTAEQHMISNRLRRTPEPTVPLTFIREKELYCAQCDNIDKEFKQVREPTDKESIFNRLLRLSQDYDIQEMNVESRPNEIVLRVKLPDLI